MHLAVISDLHADPVSLEKTLAAIDAAGVDQIVCCGDVVGYGPDPKGTIEIVRARQIPCVMGNHDASVAGVRGTEIMNATARAGVERHRALLSEADIAWLKELPYVYEGEGFACAHGDFWAPEEFPYLQEAWETGRSFRIRDERFLFVGHVHSSQVYAKYGHMAPLAMSEKQSWRLRACRKEATAIVHKVKGKAMIFDMASRRVAQNPGRMRLVTGIAH